MNILKTNGTIKVSTVVGGLIGVVVGAVIRHNAIYCYEISMFANGEYRIVMLYPNEFKLISDKDITKIGFKQE